MQHLQELSPGLLGRPRHLLSLHLREGEREGKSLNAEVTECSRFVQLGPRVYDHKFKN